MKSLVGQVKVLKVEEKAIYNSSQTKNKYLLMMVVLT